MSSTKLIRWSGLAAVAGGAILALMGLVIGLAFPAEDEAFIATSTSSLYQATMPFLVLGMVLLLLGLVGLYGRQAEQAGRFGLVAFVTAFIGIALGVSLMWVFAFVVPSLATAAPALLEADEPPGPLGAAFFVSFILFSLGFVLFGIASLRARVYPRWASILLIAGAVFAFIVDMLPFDMPIPLDQILIGAAFAWMGYILWSERHHVASDAPTLSPRPDARTT